MIPGRTPRVLAGLVILFALCVLARLAFGPGEDPLLRWLDRALRGPCCIASNGRNASATLKTIATAQADFRANDRDGNGRQDYWRGDIAGLYAISPKEGPQNAIKLIDVSCALADDRPVTDLKPLGPASPKAGYGFRALRHADERAPDPQRFAACAFPASAYGRAGARYTFIIDENNTMFRKDFRRAGCFVDVFPADPLAEGWKRLE